MVNNAGTGSFGPAEDLTDEQFDTEVDIDLYGIFRVSRAAAKKAMIPAGYGRIINVASMYGMVGSNVAGMAAYHAAKEGELDTAILFLASKASGYVVGSPILVDGGYSAI